MLEEFGNVIAPGGAGVVIASQSGHRLPPLTVEQNKALATTPVEELLRLPFLQPDQVTDSLHAYQISKRGNSLRVLAEAVRWGKRGARINTISPGIIMTPLAKDRRLVVDEAIRQGHAVRALVRNRGKTGQLPSEAQVVIGDVTRPETLSAVADGVDAIVFTFGSDGTGKVGS